MNKETKAQTAQFIEQQLKIEKFERKALRDLLGYYNKAKKSAARDINAAIKRQHNLQSKSRLSALYKEIDNKIKDLTDSLNKPISKAVGEAGAFSYTDTNRILSWDNRVQGFNNVARSPAQVASMVQDEKLGGKYLDDWLWSAMREENGALKAEVASSMIRGKGYKETMKELGGRYDNMLSAKGNKQNIETVTKSYIQSANAKAHEDIYEANSDIIESVEWSAVMESGNTATGRGTCPRCAALDGMQYKSTRSAPPCPLHPRCRCMLLPITPTWRELGFDVDEMEPVYKKWYIRSPGRKIMQTGLIDGNYADWWMTRSNKFQDASVGPRRAELIRADIIDFQDIVVPGTGRLKLLDELPGMVAKPITQPYMYQPIATAEGELGKIMTIGKCI